MSSVTPSASSETNTVAGPVADDLLYPGRRFRIEHLREPYRAYALLVLIAAAGASAIILALAVGAYPIENVLELPDFLSPIQTSLGIPFSLILIVLLGLGLAAGALMFTLFDVPSGRSRAARLALALLVMMLPISFLDFGRVFGVDLRGYAWFHTGFILTAIGCGFGALVLALRASPRHARWCAGLVSTTFFLLGFWFIFLGCISEAVGPFLIESRVTRLSMVPLSALALYLTPLVALTGIIFFWQALAEAKLFSREIGLGVASFAVRWRGLPVLLLTVKLAGLALGYAAAYAGYAGEPWQTSLRDGPLSWLIAFIFAAATGWWLARPRSRELPVPSNRVALIYTAGFLLPFILAFLLALPSSALAGLGFEGIGLALLTVSLALAGAGELWTLAFAALLLPLGLLFYKWRRFRYFAPIFLLSGAWVLPILPALAIPNSNLAVQYLTFDAALTVVLLFLGILVWRGRFLRPSGWTITLVLIVSTILALAEWPIPVQIAPAVAMLLLLLPLLYELLLDGQELNAMALADPGRVVRRLALQAILLVIVAWSVTLGLLAPDEATWEVVAERVFLPPLVALFIAAAVSRHERSASYVAD